MSEQLREPEMTTLVTSAAYAASKTLAPFRSTPTRSQLSEVISALLGYQTYAALGIEEANTSLPYHLDDAEILVLDKPSAEKRATAMGIANVSAVVQACIDAITDAAGADISVFVGIDDFYDSYARNRMVLAAISSDEVSSAMAECNADFDEDPEFPDKKPAADNLWQARAKWTIEADGEWVGSYDPDADRMFNGDTLHCSAKLSYDKAGRSGLVESNSEAYGANLVLVVPGDHGVLHQRRCSVQKRQPHCADMHPCPSTQLEVFGNPAIEEQAFGWLRRINEPQGISHPIEALFVECRTTGVRCIQIGATGTPTCIAASARSAWLMEFPDRMATGRWGEAPSRRRPAATDRTDFSASP